MKYQGKEEIKSIKKRFNDNAFTYEFKKEIFEQLDHLKFILKSCEEDMQILDNTVDYNSFQLTYNSDQRRYELIV